MVQIGDLLSTDLSEVKATVEAVFSLVKQRMEDVKFKQDSRKKVNAAEDEASKERKDKESVQRKLKAMEVKVN